MKSEQSGLRQLLSSGKKSLSEVGKQLWNSKLVAAGQRWLSERGQSWWTGLLTILFIVASVLMLMGCVASMPASKGRAPLDASLIAPCESLPLLTETTGAAALRWMLGAVDLYKDCADSKAKLIEAVH